MGYKRPRLYGELRYAILDCMSHFCHAPARVCVAANMFDLAYWHLTPAFSVTSGPLKVQQWPGVGLGRLEGAQERHL